MATLTFSLPAKEDALLIAPVGLSTPHASVVSVDLAGASVRLIGDPHSAQQAMALTPQAGEIRLTYRVAPGGAAYPEALFAHRDSRYTRSAAALAEEAGAIAKAAGGASAAIHALANHVAALFRYGHPEQRYYDAYNEIPQLCGLTEGSCVDINAYFIASCRAAGLDAGYVTGCFVPEEKRSWCNDMHCWVVTRADGKVLEWDIAHHLKLGRAPVAPGLNPKPGVRVPLAHSMGLNFPEVGIRDVKLIGEPMWFGPDRGWRDADVTIRLDGYDDLL